MDNSTIQLSAPAQQASELFAAGKLGAAKDVLDAYLPEHPDDANALFLRAGILVRTGGWDPASLDLERLLALEPTHYEGLVLQGLIRKNQHRFAEAVDTLQKAIALNPEDPSAYNTLGMCFLSMRNIDAAINAFQQAIQRNPRAGATYQNLGLALRLAEKRHLALEAFQRAVEYAPGNPTNFISLSEQLRRMGRKGEAITCLEEGRKRHPRCLPILLALAGALGDANRGAEAESLFAECLRIEPSAVQAYALWLQDQGRFADAVQQLQRSIDLYPQQGLAYMALAEAKHFQLANGEPWEPQVETLLKGPGSTKFARMYLWYALAKAKEAGRHYEEAMHAFDEANALAYGIYNEGRPFDPALGKKVTERTINLYSKSCLEGIQFGSTSSKPILIVGMVRSGTTLLDQIVSSHSQVRAAGETTFWMEESDRLYARWRDGLLAEDLPDLANRYLAHLADEAGDAPRITDKMPLNFLHLGHVHAALPNAKILHIRRNPLDTCLSIYATHFGGGPHFAYKKENIVFYYQEYLRLMEHWRRVLPRDRFFELDYEDLVANKERVVAEVLDFCELPWEDASLHHEENAASINTPSRWQARQPVYTTSVAKWKPYEPWLGGFDALKTAEHPPLAGKGAAR